MSVSAEGGKESSPSSSILWIDGPAPASGQQTAISALLALEDVATAAPSGAQHDAVGGEEIGGDSKLNGVEVEARATVPNATAPDRAHVRVGVSSAVELEEEEVETRLGCLADILLRVPMCGILQFFWFAFHMLAFGPNVVVTAVNVLLSVTCMNHCLFL